MKKYKVIALSALIAAGFTSCDLTEKPTSYYEKDTYFETMDQAKMSVVGIYDCLAIDKHYGQFEMAMPASDDTYYIQGTGTDNTRRCCSQGERLWHIEKLLFLSLYTKSARRIPAGRFWH